MVKFSCKKLGRDKDLENFKSEKIIPQYKVLSGNELNIALKMKLAEEINEVCEANSTQEIIDELADVLIVIKGLCKAYGFSFEDIEQINKQKYEARGGFENGLYIESLEMNDSNPKVTHFRRSPEKYPEIK